jgi:phage shock protein A
MSSTSTFSSLSSDEKLKFQQDRLTAQAAVASATAAVNEVEEHLKQLRKKYATRNEYLQNFNTLTTKTSAESASTSMKSSDDGAMNFKKVPSTVKIVKKPGSAKIS